MRKSTVPFRTDRGEITLLWILGPAYIACLHWLVPAATVSPVMFPSYSCFPSPHFCELQEERSHVLAAWQILSEPPHSTHWSQAALKMLVDWFCHTFTEIHLRLGGLRGPWSLDSSFYYVFICKRVHLPLFQFLHCVDVVLFCWKGEASIPQASLLYFLTS